MSIANPQSPTPRPSALPTAVLISGGGRTLHNIIEEIDAGELPLTVRLVIASTPRARGLQFAEKASIPIQVVDRGDFTDDDSFSEAVFEYCRDAGAELVVLGGFLKRLVVPDDFINRVTNIHPALMPAFCGKGYYGHHVHEAVLQYGAKLSGCTVHFVDNEYDHGPVILQKCVPVMDDDTADTLAARVFEAECEAYPEALRLVASGRAEIRGRRVRVLPGE
jgi:phosphoribosylglycinamide formyltransferase 1